MKTEVKMIWKNVIAAMLGVVIPIAWSAITNSQPDFPLTIDSFTELVLWAVGLVIGGWNAKVLRFNYLNWKRSQV